MGSPIKYSGSKRRGALEPRTTIRRLIAVSCLTVAAVLSFLPQQLRQLGDIRRDPSRLVLVSSLADLYLPGAGAGAGGRGANEHVPVVALHVPGQTVPGGQTVHPPQGEVVVDCVTHAPLVHTWPLWQEVLHPPQFA